MASTSSHDVPSVAADAVLVQSQPMPEDSVKVTGYDFNKGIDHHELLKSYLTSGFQATNFGLAVEQINAMIAKREEPLPEDFVDTEENEFTKVKNNCTIFLGYTSNMASCGVRESIKFLVQHKMASDND